MQLKRYQFCVLILTICSTLFAQTGTMTGNDGKTYKTVKIGNQWWMAENLRETQYRDGAAIPNVESGNQWVNLSTGAYCAYDNSESTADTNGYLYNWFALADKRNIAPAGWHVPTDEEWKELEMALGMSQSEADEYGYRGTNEGSKLAGRADLWYDGDLESNAAFGESAFSALPGGGRYFDGHFGHLGDYAYFWAATESSTGSAWARALYYGRSGVARSSSNKQNGFSVRLVRD